MRLRELADWAAAKCEQDMAVVQAEVDELREEARRREEAVTKEMVPRGWSTTGPAKLPPASSPEPFSAAVVLPGRILRELTIANLVALSLPPSLPVSSCMCCLVWLRLIQLYFRNIHSQWHFMCLHKMLLTVYILRYISHSCGVMPCDSIALL